MNYNCIIIGSGLAGLNCALNAAKKGSVLLISKGKISSGNTWLAQGGIAAAMEKTDSPEKHIKDTLVAGGYHNNKKTVEFIVKSAPKIINDLISLGMPFEKEKNGALALKLEGGHGMNRIVHYYDYTGQKVAETLIKKVRQNKKITIMENAFATDLLVKNKACYGVRVILKNKFLNIFGDNTVLATGGLGQVFSKTTNPVTATGDGIALADKAGCKLKDLEFIQFHPTALKRGKSPLFLLSETLRGHGAKLLNTKGERFMVKVHPLADLAPRDIVSRMMFYEENKGPVYLDLRGIKNLKKDFPSIYAKLLSLRINPFKDLIPTTAVAHYSCGGVITDLKGRTNIKNLYAAGEVACTGLHGANRLASNSLLEAAVMGKQVADNLEKSSKMIPFFTTPKIKKQKSSKTLLIKIQNLMWKNVGIIRNTKNLQKNIKELSIIQKHHPPATDQASIQAHFLVQTAFLVTKSAAARKHSLGCHSIK
jgi:L-aspartate oxidase